MSLLSLKNEKRNDCAALQGDTKRFFAVTLLSFCCHCAEPKNHYKRNTALHL